MAHQTFCLATLAKLSPNNKDTASTTAAEGNRYLAKKEIQLFKNHLGNFCVTSPVSCLRQLTIKESIVSCLQWSTTESDSVPQITELKTSLTEFLFVL